MKYNDKIREEFWIAHLNPLSLISISSPPMRPCWKSLNMLRGVLRTKEGLLEARTSSQMPQEFRFNRKTSKCKERQESMKFSHGH